MKILQSAIQVGSLTLHNRLVMPPMATAKSLSDGRVTPQLCQYYDEKSKGGYIGLVIAEHSYVSQAGKASQGQLSIASDSEWRACGKWWPPSIKMAQRHWRRSTTRAPRQRKK